MNNHIRVILGACCIVLLGLGTASASGDESTPFVLVAGTTRAPIGWVEFCVENPQECEARSGLARDAALTGRSWKELVRINKLVNDGVRPMTDLDHYGVVEKWAYPNDGYGDCEDYVLLKQRMLTEAGWPRQALLITVVRDHKGDGHAVLTVKTDRGEFILDNQNADILLWSETSYRYVKRQSQGDPNVWVSLGDPRPAVSTATSR